MRSDTPERIQVLTEMDFFNRALSIEEVEALYDGTGVPRICANCEKSFVMIQGVTYHHEIEYYEGEEIRDVYCSACTAERESNRETQ